MKLNMTGYFTGHNKMIKNSPTVNPPESYFFPKPANAGLIRMRVLLEGSLINLLKVLSNFYLTYCQTHTKNIALA